MRFALLSAVVFAVSCASPSSTPSENLFENHSETSDRVRGLSRVNTGAFVQGTKESFTAVYLPEGVKTVEWTATAGALTSSGDSATWTLPELDTAVLTLTLVMNDGARIDTLFDFLLVPQFDIERPVKSAHEALLTAPMPVFDGGSDITGGACELEYDSSANIHMVFTSSTHPALYYAKWNGSTWAIEVVDAMGFNTGGSIGIYYARVKVDASGNPHILYRRNGTARYATRVGTGAWTYERIDTTVQSTTLRSGVQSLAIDSSGRAVVAYNGTFAASPYTRPVVATRIAPGTWSNIAAFPAVITDSDAYITSDLLLNGSVAYFSVYGYSSSTDYFESWNGTVASALLLQSESTYGTPLPGASATWAGANRMLLRTVRGVYDFGINTTTFTNTTQSWWSLETTSASTGDIAWNGRPVVLHHHGTSLELVTTASTGASYWTWQQLGTSTDESASVAVHPTSGVPSICYQSNGRIMFQ
jgi:hypothetical protein